MLSKQFRALRFLGAGPDGTALAAQRRDGGREVELRFVQEHAQTDALLERWARYQLVDHPNVISLQQVENAGSEWCAVLDTAPLATLEQALGQPWKAEAGVRLLEQLAGALVAVHEVGLWHGHLDPSAVALCPKRGARLEFTGVLVWNDASSGREARAAWQEAEPCDDILRLALIAERLFGGARAAHARLPWIDRLKDEDRLLRPSASDVLALLGQALTLARNDASARLELENVDTERPRGAQLGAARPPPLPARPVPPPLVVHGTGARVGRFELGELLGEGGMGSVYRAVDAATGQCVALKLLRPELLRDEAVRYRFKKEARVLKAVKSPYVANLIEADITDSSGYIALEFVDGKDLASLLEGNEAPLSEALALQLVADMCRALVEPHRRGIIHRDIKPQNVLIVGELRKPHELTVKVCDFGIASAKLSAETLGMTQDGRLWGTPQYMSPEQCTCSAVSPATDVYALGLTLYELIAGRPAFDGTEVLQLLRQQMSEQPPSLSDCATVSVGTAALVARALEKSPALRFADAGELLESIEQVRNGQAGALVPGSRAVPAGGRSFLIEFSVELTSTPHELWPYVSDTARLNEVIGLPPVEVERVSGDGSSKTYLSNRVLGIDMRWQEYPFEWVEGHRWSVLRVFEKGLTRWYRVRMELEALPGGGTRLHYSMEFEPIFALLAFIVKFEVGVKQKAKLLTVFRRVDTLIREGAARRAPSPHVEPRAVDAKLARLVAAKLDALRAAHVDEACLKALEAHVLHAPDVEVARLRPVRFARAHSLPERAFIEACLLATRQGLFNLLWDVVCPLCQIPATFAESLQRLETHSSCPACELSFPLNFADSVELVFRVAPEVRPNEVRAYCIGGPSHSPHVAAQLSLGPGEGRVLSLELSDGQHRIRSPQLPGVIELDVSARHGFSRADLVVGSRLSVLRRAGLDAEDPRLELNAAEPVVELGSGQQTLSLRNQLPHDVTLRVERTADREDALTAARVWSMPRFRELFPGETLQSGRLVAVGQLSFMVLRVIDHLSLIDRQGDAVALADTLLVFDQLHALAEKHNGQLTSSTMDAAVAVFERPADAIASCLALSKALADPALLGCGLALHRGPAVATTINDRMQYYGRTLAEALELSASTRCRELVMSSASLGDELASVTAQAGIAAAVRPAAKLGPAAWCLHLELAEPERRAGEAAA